MHYRSCREYQHYKTIMKMKQILIIEDDINIRETLSDILELKGYDVIAAEDGQSGILKAARYKPDLIICDIMMQTEWLSSS